MAKHGTAMQHKEKHSKSSYHTAMQSVCMLAKETKQFQSTGEQTKEKHRKAQDRAANKTPHSRAQYSDAHHSEALRRVMNQTTNEDKHGTKLSSCPFSTAFRVPLA